MTSNRVVPLYVVALTYIGVAWFVVWGADLYARPRPTDGNSWLRNTTRLSLLHAALVLCWFVNKHVTPAWYTETDESPNLVVGSPKAAWLLKEASPLMACAFVFSVTTRQVGCNLSSCFVGQPAWTAPWALFFVYHLYRGVVYPLVILVSTSPVPIDHSLAECARGAFTGYLQAATQAAVVLAAARTKSSGEQGEVIPGAVVFAIGLLINIHADWTLRTRRLSRTSGIPSNGLFRFVCQPNFFGDLVAWTGFVIATNGNATAVILLLQQVAMLVPQSLRFHAMCAEKYGDAYTSAGRKAVIPFLL